MASDRCHAQPAEVVQLQAIPAAGDVISRRMRVLALVFDMAESVPPVRTECRPIISAGSVEHRGRGVSGEQGLCATNSLGHGIRPRGIKWCKILERFQPNEELQKIGRFLDLLDQFFINEPDTGPTRVLLINSPSAIRKGFAGAPQPLQNCAA
jgi:hypothetical protein